MKKLKVMTVVGTRPEIIRLSAVINRLDQSEAIEYILIFSLFKPPHSKYQDVLDQMAPLPTSPSPYPMIPDFRYCAYNLLEYRLLLIFLLKQNTRLVHLNLLS